MKKIYSLPLALITILVIQSFSGIAHTVISGQVKSSSTGNAIVMYWKGFSLITDTLLLNRNKEFSQQYNFTEPMYIRIIADISSPFMLVFPEESLHVQINDKDIILSGDASAYNTFLLGLWKHVMELGKAKTDQNEIVKYVLAESHAFFATCTHKQADIMKQLTMQSFLLQLKFYPAIVKYSADPGKMEVLKRIVQGNPPPEADHDLWLYLGDINYNQEANRYDFQYLNMMNNLVRILRFQGVKKDSTLTATDAYLVEKDIIKNIFPASPVRTALLAYNLDYRIKSYTDFPAQLGEVDKFITDFEKEENDSKAYVPAIVEKYSIAKASFGSLAKGATAPSFKLKDIQGKVISLSDYRGKVVYLDIWASWCGPCLKEMPYLNIIKQKYQDKALEIISISIDTKITDWEKKIKALDLTGVQLIDPTGSEKSAIAKDYHLSGVPHFVLIDKQGKIAMASAPRPSEMVLLENALAELLQ